ncbi:MAG TPA: pantoate--beta-alanine ligase [Acidobacteriaceae bacterium]|nr:pantoate--beta-alanine ligase [Acidobacteriaceae bacterium]
MTMQTLATTQTLSTIAAMRDACAEARGAFGARCRLGLVPTMGALHEGHLSLIRAAKRECDVVAVSIFVNPTQFAPGEDFERYPRPIENDSAVLEAEEVDLVFAPSAEEMYPHGVAQALVDVPDIGVRLDGQFRPGHFRAVATVVAKLFHIVGPDLAFFGQKDAAQVAVLRAMVRELDFPLQLRVCPTVRESDGLALSSRNRYLTAEQRSDALALWRSLSAVRILADARTADAAALRQAMLRVLQSSPNMHVEYADIVDPDTLLPLDNIREGALVAVAAHVGTTRLIDNIFLPPSIDGSRR